MIDRDRLVSVTRTTSAARGKCARFLLIFCLLFIDLGFEPTFKCERALCTQVPRSSGCLGCHEKLSRNVVYARFSNPHIFSCWLEQSDQSRLISPARTRSIQQLNEQRARKRGKDIARFNGTRGNPHETRGSAAYALNSKVNYDTVRRI